MHLSKTLRSLLAIDLAIILYNKLHRLMSRKQEIVEGSGNLGIRIILVAFRASNLAFLLRILR